MYALPCRLVMGTQHAVLVPARADMIASASAIAPSTLSSRPAAVAAAAVNSTAIGSPSSRPQVSVTAPVFFTRVLHRLIAPRGSIVAADHSRDAQHEVARGTEPAQAPTNDVAQPFGNTVDCRRQPVSRLRFTSFHQMTRDLSDEQHVAFCPPMNGELTPPHRFCCPVLRMTSSRTSLMLRPRSVIRRNALTRRSSTSAALSDGDRAECITKAVTQPPAVLLGVVRVGRPTGSRSASFELGPGAPDVARILPELQTRLGIAPRPLTDPEQDRWSLLSSITELVQAIALTKSLLLLLEDLQWADRGTLDLLLFLSRNLGGSPLLVIGTYRDAEVARSHPLSSALVELRRRANFARLPLRGLSFADVQTMLTTLAKHDVSLTVAQTLQHHRAGNPLDLSAFHVGDAPCTHDSGLPGWRLAASPR